MTVDLRAFWDAVPPERRHVVTAMSVARMRNQFERWDRYSAPHVRWEEIATVLDWGCGGGLLATHVAANRPTRLWLADVSRESLREAVATVPSWEFAWHLPNHPREYGEIRTPDLLICHAVIHHLPGLRYFEALAAWWREIARPRWMSLQWRNGTLAERSGDDYAATEGYMFGLTLPGKMIAQMFPEYDIRNFAIDGCWGHAVLERYKP